MVVLVSFEYDVDVEDLDPEFVDIEGFACEEALRMFDDDYISGDLPTPCVKIVSD